MSNLAESIEEIIANIETLFSYAQSADQAERSFHHKRIKNGKLFAAFHAEAGYRFAPSKFAGYAANDLRHAEMLPERDGRITNGVMNRFAGKPLAPGDSGYAGIDRQFMGYCRTWGIEPSRHHRPRQYWRVTAPSAFTFPEEVGDDRFWEGATIAVSVNRFERSRTARDRCLAHFGYACMACGVMLEDIYGELGKQLIHVHHVVPLSVIKEDYQVDPIKDLRPVCPNCHAIIHRRKEPLSVEEVRGILRPR
ncbi:MAG: HNH endonuclease [Paracoccaceae bacterium]